MVLLQQLDLEGFEALATVAAVLARFGMRCGQKPHEHWPDHTAVRVNFKKDVWDKTTATCARRLGQRTNGLRRGPSFRAPFKKT